MMGTTHIAALPRPRADSGLDCLTPIVVGVALLIVGAIVLAISARRAHERKARERAITVVAMQEQAARNAAYVQQQAMVRFANLSARFGAEAANRIIRREIWQGQTEGMLREAIGAPADVDETVLKTKCKRTYKYSPQGANRYGLRVFFENGIVVGWEDKR